MASIVPDAVCLYIWHCQDGFLGWFIEKEVSFVVLLLRLVLVEWVWLALPA